MFTYQGFRYVEIVASPEYPKLENFICYDTYNDMKQLGAFESSNVMLNKLHKNIMWSLNSNFVDIPTDCPQRSERLAWTGDAQMFARTASYMKVALDGLDGSFFGATPTEIIMNGYCAESVSIVRDSFKCYVMSNLKSMKNYTKML